LFDTPNDSTRSKTGPLEKLAEVVAVEQVGVFDVVNRAAFAKELRAQRPRVVRHTNHDAARLQHLKHLLQKRPRVRDMVEYLEETDQTRGSRRQHTWGKDSANELGLGGRRLEAALGVRARLDFDLAGKPFFSHRSGA